MKMGRMTTLIAMIWAISLSIGSSSFAQANEPEFTVHDLELSYFAIASDLQRSLDYYHDEGTINAFIKSESLPARPAIECRVARAFLGEGHVFFCHAVFEVNRGNGWETVSCEGLMYRVSPEGQMLVRVNHRTQKKWNYILRRERTRDFTTCFKKLSS